MKKAALYARVSTDRQREKHTIESQLFELKRQIAAAGEQLVREYIDDGYSGEYLDRPALEQIRQDQKADVFDAIYFLCADRIARMVVHQDIIVNELLAHKKRIVIDGKDYRENPENRLALTMFGAFAQFEKAKIAERMLRGRLHRVRTGQLVGQGHNLFGYRYIRKTETTEPALVIHEEEAAVVRLIFDLYANQGLGGAAICRLLEERGFTTQTGRTLWQTDRLSKVLKNETYSGVRYYNQTSYVKTPSADGKRPTYKKREIRDRGEWIAIKVPAIVSRELFDKAQERLRVSASRYKKPPTYSLFGGLVECAECGRVYSSAYWYGKWRHRDGTVSVGHRGAYRCSRHVEERCHHPSKRGTCGNPTVATNILDGTIVELIRDIILDPAKLALRTESAGEAIDTDAVRELSKVSQGIDALEAKRQDLFRSFAAERVSGDEYIAASRSLDETYVQLKRKKAALAAAVREGAQADVVGASVRRFCLSARARFEACADFESKRAFVKDHIAKVVFNHGKITILGSVPVRGVQEGLPFRVEGQIDREIVRNKQSRKRWPEDERVGSWVPADNSPKVAPALAISSAEAVA